MLLLISFGYSFAQFEGMMDMKIILYDEGESEEIFYSMSVKKNLMATNIKNPGREGHVSTFIFRGDKQVLWIVNDEEKSYLELSVKDDLKSPKIKGNEKVEDPKLRVKRTGKKEVIHGYTCEEVIIEDGKEVIHIWGTAKLGNFYKDLMQSFGDITGGADPEPLKVWEDELMKLKLFPLKIVTMEEGKVTHQQETTKIVNKTLPASTFEVPKGFKKEKMDFNMEKMFREMEQQMKNEEKDTAADGENEE